MLDTGGSIIQVRHVALTCSCLPGLKPLLRLVAWEMKWANLRGDMGVFEKGLREEWQIEDNGGFSKLHNPSLLCSCRFSGYVAEL